MACPCRRLPGKFHFTRNKIGTWHASVDVCQGNFILPTLYTTDGNMACSCRRLPRKFHFTHNKIGTWHASVDICLPGKFHFTHNKIGTWHASVDVCLPGTFHFTHTTYNRMGAWLVKWTRRTSRATARENKKSDAPAHRRPKGHSGTGAVVDFCVEHNPRSVRVIRFPPALFTGKLLNVFPEDAF